MAVLASKGVHARCMKLGDITRKLVNGAGPPTSPCLTGRARAYVLSSLHEGPDSHARPATGVSVHHRHAQSADVFIWL